MTKILNDPIKELESKFRGKLITSGENKYDDARKLYKAMFDKNPAVISRCANVADVIHAVTFAQDENLSVAIRSGGHNAAGLGSYDDGLVIDLSTLKGIRVDPKTQTARVEPGCIWGEVDHATHAFGLATPSGVISTTGVGGLTLGGGHGYLSRKYGLTIDNLLEVDMVLADGAFVTANANQNEDLFWAVRGGGGIFGIVTSLLFRLHPVDTIVGGPTFWPLENSGKILRWYREFIREAPEDLYGFFAYLTVPPVPLFPEELHGEKVCGAIWCYTGPAEKAHNVFKPVREISEPLIDNIQELPYPMLQSVHDDLYPPGLYWYKKANFVKEITDEAITIHEEYSSKMPSIHSTMHLYPINGASHRVGSNDTAFSHRDANWSQVIIGVDPDPSNNDKITDWARSYSQALQPHANSGGYVNFMMDEGKDRIKATYRGNYERLVKIKKKYDPDNFFRVNQNIKPE